jgi:hypothetical protein
MLKLRIALVLGSLALAGGMLAGATVARAQPKPAAKGAPAATQPAPTAAGEDKLQKAIAEEEKLKAAEKAAEENRKREAEEARAKERAEELKKAKAKQQALEAQCQFRPVMSDDDIDKCRVAYPSR